MQLVSYSFILFPLFHCALIDLMDNSFLMKELLNNLNRFHKREAPITALKAVTLMPNSKQSRFPNDIYLTVCQYLELNDILAFGLTFKDTFMASKISVINRLYLYNPHYIFDKFWMNSIILKILEEHLPFESYDVFHDNFHLLSFKLITNQLDHTRIPKVTYLMVLAFIYESVFGLETQVPINSKDWRLSFVLSLSPYQNGSKRMSS